MGKRTRKPPKPPIAPNLASVAAELGDEFDIERRFHEALWKIALGQRYGSPAEGLMLAAGIKTVWAFERALRRNRWEPSEREAFGAEIVAAVESDWYFHAIVKIEIDNIVFRCREYRNMSDEHQIEVSNIAASDVCENIDKIVAYLHGVPCVGHRKKYSGFLRRLDTCFRVRKAVFG